MTNNISSDVSLLWEKVLEEAQKHLSRPSFETWIKSTRPVSVDEESIYIEVPNDYTRNVINSNHKTFLIDTINKLSNKNYDISFTCNNSLNSHFNEPALNIINPYDYETNNHNQNNEVAPSQNTYSLQSNTPWLNPKYTFDTFVVGNCNRLAHAASLAVAEAPSKAYNPLFIYGGVGLGKTHLMHAISHYVISNYKNNKVVYLSSEKFTNEFINAIRDNRTLNFRNKYRNIDVLLIDDIQFLEGKEQTQEEFFHTFNALHESNKQIIVSSDRLPKDIPTLEDRLRSRFEWGLITDMTKPDLETRIAILKKKARLENIEVNNEVINFVANKIETNIRELEGALIRIVALASLNKIPIDLHLADEALKNIIFEKKNEVTVSKIMQVTAQFYDISTEDILTSKRSHKIAFPRQVAMYLCREMTDLSLPKIGKEFGGKDHTTVMHACKKITNSIKDNLEIKSNVEKIKEQIKGY